MCSITSEFEKIPLFFIARGKTERSERNQIGDVDENEKTHSTKSFMAKSSKVKYYTYLLQPLDVSVFGPLKAMADAALHKYLFENLSNKIGMIKAV